MKKSESISLGFLIGTIISMLLSMAAIVLVIIHLANAPVVTIVFFVYMIVQLISSYIVNLTLYTNDFFNK